MEKFSIDQSPLQERRVILSTNAEFPKTQLLLLLIAMISIQVGFKFTIRRDFKFIEEILTNWNIPYDKQTSAGKTSSLHAKDPDGNELCLLRKDIYVGMPIGN